MVLLELLRPSDVVWSWGAIFFKFGAVKLARSIKLVLVGTAVTYLSHLDCRCCI